MLSIIISSYQPHYFSALEKNIAETVGVPYELIKVDNPDLMSICEAYNLGAAKARFENMLFLHEDVEFRTQNWGEIVVNYLRKRNIGIIGVLGSDYVPNVPFAWWNLFENNFSHYTQYENGTLIGDYNLTENKKASVIDGVFMAVRKEVFNEFRFNDKISGFHGYDVVFSLNVVAKYQNIVISNIKIAHFSYAVNSLNREWMDTLIHSRKFYSVPRGQQINKKKEVFSFLKFYAYLKQFSYPKTKIIVYLLKYSKFSTLGFRGLLKSSKLIFKEILA
ncbi:hypothetical protein CO230_10815 [Chryseobacterium sp. 6424]|uniref:glycosyltransferase n=1 Tax=Chryseobacterium sp. 6424 TaxID=2039166 RepID=UPI000EFD15E3|nr:glycosyltransferase [Chryseobacterium sp. 6424]AYO58561.1 hypothetical protein CO230_10815 [Chryseobacterium sp. 6424]